MNAAWFYNGIGAVGGLLILMGFYRTSIGKWKNKSFLYELDNLVGALMIVIYQLHVGAYISVGLNIIWAIIAFKGVASFAERYDRKRKAMRKRKKTA
jgi:hypothetical protein